MKIYLVIYLGIILSLNICGQQINIAKYKKIKMDKTPLVKIINPNFEAGKKGWKINKKAKIENNAGSVASAGLFYKRTNPKEYVIIGSQRLNVVPGKTYNFSAMIRGEGVKDVNNHKIGRGGTFCIGLLGKNGKWMRGGVYPKGVRGTTDWTRIEIKNFKIPEKASTAIFSFYLDHNMVGKVWFDDATITSAKGSWTVYPANVPMLQAVQGQKIKLVFSNSGKTIMNEAATGKLFVYAEWNGKIMSAPIIKDQAKLQLSQNASGHGQLKIKILDTERKLILEENEFPLTVGTTNHKMSSYCHFDSKKRAIVNGKKFLPIGVFCSIKKRSELQLLKKIGFNSLLIYNSVSMGFSKSPICYRRAMEVFDFCKNNKLKIIFSIKNFYAGAGRRAITSLYGDKGTDKIVRRIVSLFKNHPALLAWYICDELPNQMIPELIKRRQLLNKLDPNHPVWSLCSLGYSTKSLRIYGPASDVIGSDAYPIAAGNSIESMVPKLEEGVQTGLPHWFTLQMHNKRRYCSKTSKAAQYRFPSENEFRSMILLAAGYGVNGYFFYNYMPLCYPDTYKDGNSQANLKTVKKGITLLNKLKPFLLSDKKLKKVPLKILKGKVKAWQLTDNNENTKIIIVALGPGEAEAELPTTFNKNYHSEYGLCVKKKGKWIFKTKNIDSDILNN